MIPLYAFTIRFWNLKIMIYECIPIRITFWVKPLNFQYIPTNMFEIYNEILAWPHLNSWVYHTVQEWLEIKFYCLWIFSTFHIHKWWGQSKYVRKFEISRANFEKTQNLYILKIFLWILCINMQNCSNSKELRHK